METQIAEMLRCLTEGNERFVRGDTGCRYRQQPAREDLAQKADPFAAVLACSEAVIPPEFIFDQPVGDLYVVKVAGPVLDDVTVGSLEYAVERLGVRLVAVLGHDDCRVIEAAVTDAAAPAGMGTILDAIETGVIRARRDNIAGAELLTQAVDQHIRAMVETLKGSRVMHPLVDRHELWIVGGMYHVVDGAVEWLPE